MAPLRRMQPHPSLKQTEIRLYRLITYPEGLKGALQAHPAWAPPIRPSPTLTPAERVDIYANMYFYRILDSLKEDFGRVLRVIGEVNFHNLITGYLAKHPPTSFTLRNVGQHLPQFLKRHPLTRKWASLSDLARLEWELIEIFDASDSPILTRAHLRKIAPEKWGGLKLRLIPASSLQRFSFRVDRVSDKKAGGTKAISKKPVVLLFWRKDFRVYFRPVEKLEEGLHKKLNKGSTFGALCEAAVRSGAGKDPALTMGKFLERWVENGILIKPGRD